MPSCCLLLCRSFLRVDGVRAVLRDTRWFIDFGKSLGDATCDELELRQMPTVENTQGVALLLCNVVHRGGDMTEVRKALGLPLAEYQSAMLRADAALASAGLHPVVAESLQRRGQLPLVSSSVSGGSSCVTRTSESTDERLEDPKVLAHGLGLAIEADALSALEPSAAETWALKL